MLASSLKAVICQTLVPTIDGNGRVAAREIMLVNPALANMIKEGKTMQMYNAIDTGGKIGMISMDRSLANLVKEGIISRETAESKANNFNLLKSYLDGSPVSVD